MHLNWDEVKGLIEGSPKKIAILSHRSPDGDSIGSSLGIYHFLQAFNHPCSLISPDPAPPFLHWLPGFENFINYEQHGDKAMQILAEADVIFCLDFNSPSRMGALLEAFNQRKKDSYIINIDHHQQPEDFAHFQLSDVTASSTAELIHDFMSGIGQLDKLNSSIASCLYTGILTDTGSFRFSSTSPKTHRIAANLMEMNIDINAIYQRIFDNYSQDRIKLLGFALKDKLNLYPKYATAIIDLSEKELSQFNFQKGDTEGLVNFPLSIGWVKMSVLLTQKDGIVKMSFRSKGNFSVNRLAREHFNGGGHENAAGGMCPLSMEDTLEKLVGILPKFEKEILNSAI